MKAMDVQSKLLARNTLLNLIGQTLPLVIAFAVIPFIARELGADRFGLVSLAWALLGSFTLFNLGLGRAATKFAAEYLGRGEIERLPALIWTSLGLQLLLGISGGLILAAAAPVLVGSVFNIPPELTEDAYKTFIVLAASLPIVLGNIALRGVLEAVQRFDMINAVRVPLGCSAFLLPALAVLLGGGVPTIVLLLSAAWFAATLAYLLFCVAVFPSIKERPRIDLGTLRSLLSYGGWVTVSNAVGPILVYLDRFLIGALLTLSAVGFYTAPYEVVTRLWILPGSLVAVLFPAFSALGEAVSQRTRERLYAHSVKYLVLLAGPAALFLIFFAEELLRLWLGAEFSEQSTSVLQILAIGVLVNSLAWVPFSLLQAVGRPDITAKFHLLEVLVHAGTAWFLIGRLGIVGAALAWSLRAVLDALLLFGACRSLRLASLGDAGLVRSIAAVLGLGAAVLLAMALIGKSLYTQAFATAVLATVFARIVWRHLLDERERSLVISAVWRHAQVTKGSG